MSIKTKLFVLVAIPLAATSLVTLTGFLQMGRMASQSETLVNQEFEPLVSQDVKVMHEVADSVTFMLNADRDAYQATLAYTQLQLFPDQAASLAKDIADNVQQVSDRMDKASAGFDAEMSTSHQTFRGLFAAWQTSMTAAASGNQDAATRELLQKQFTAMRSSLDALVGKQEERMKAAEKAISEKHQRALALSAETQRALGQAQTIFLMLALLSMALVIAVGWLVFRQIAAPVERIANSLRLGSEQILGASNQLSDAGQQLARATSEQAGALEETSAVLQQMSATVAHNARQASEASAQAEAVGEEGRRGMTTMQELRKSMDEIIESNDRIQELVKVIEAIGAQTEIIDEIVFQTKILSFNAAVEAERAGESGRGFTVVAHEMGTLAQMSSSAATQISGIVKSSIQKTMDIISENRKRVEAGFAHSQQMEQVLASLTRSGSTLAEGSRSILAASEQQNQGLSQVVNAMASLEGLTQQNAGISEEAAGASEELNAQAAALRDMVSDLAELVGGKRSA